MECALTGGYWPAPGPFDSPVPSFLMSPAHLHKRPLLRPTKNPLCGRTWRRNDVGCSCGGESGCARIPRGNCQLRSADSVEDWVPRLCAQSKAIMRGKLRSSRWSSALITPFRVIARVVAHDSSGGTSMGIRSRAIIHSTCKL
jgi:hypothetical protein